MKYLEDWNHLLVLVQSKKWRLIAILALLVAGVFLGTQNRKGRAPASSIETKGPSVRNGSHLIQLSPDILKDYPISAVVLQRVKQTEEVILTGRVQYDPSQIAIISARAQGGVSAVYVKEADPVNKLQMLATLQ